ncbi:hypothetical protein RND81_02G057900 [Saponaria officinalis]|uniref:Endonuclease/exonuclease/phosphatase domain-containing protein n=1 Tax=Saponaria officinalis TaxID=3572 RepID=A0AAW1MJQ4_SAPOF
MKISSWNIRGCNNPLKLREAGAFLRNNRIDIFGLLESKIKEAKAVKIAKSEFKSYGLITNYSHHKNGCIWVLWNSSTITVSPLLIQGQLIHCHVLHHSKNVQFHVTFVYGYNDPREKQLLWSSLFQIRLSVLEWLVLGDFNVVRDVAERISSCPPAMSDVLDFNNCLSHCDLDDLHSSGCEFTWSNKQEGASRVWCKLDRALANSAWLLSYPSTSVQFLSPGVSDHSPLLLNLLEDSKCKPGFSFLNC